ncbi:MAG: Re/Si-specific NAD(P)(+) transhydrogenase subunit alpha [Alphaproteobacteria bacterium]|nr:Re/Si-specific NAD(P)(+) transhydrogenase subunit alpha [Alphaproteobacteria bacterium]MDP6255436.1 Re/Si-specific NAD(P)(+) transhydrogenase subunit alpha [Alphaproteobacteria bacterium]MDP7055058.1 Re/Si-specific NAD(P)(+) transhydrogenase subunit alpha [Alphaproteobacteria bacterium]MDP7231216.1 Re/Si-specific NAD(P)(+) transhydrogenase subunit alpha [Alphaproteobacteria bacterium]MDP7462410.1 Re/Si-specific NAD(P)(+) transhydrogenase subunit alpha [Alphaproteobacteria bacterium]
MKIAVMKERRANERRVAATPETVKKFVGLGVDVVVEAGAGGAAHIADSEFQEAGAVIAADAAVALTGADVVLKVRRPLMDDEDEGPNELALMAKGQALVAMLNPLIRRSDCDAYAAAGIDAYAMELMPRITRAQSMDVLSSQANLAGYKAVLDATEEYDRALPMMMTAAGTIAPAKVFVMGAGVAGLQAIATARRLGAVVSATDVRPVAKEQVESLGAKFVMVEDEEAAQAETAAGYAKEMSDEYQKKQAALITETIAKQDIVICTALIPGRTAPTLVTEAMVASMRPGSVIVDLAVENGGNCALSKMGEVVEAKGVKIVGHSNFPARLAVDASSLYARNLFNFLSPHIDGGNGNLSFDFEDETVSGVCLTRDGSIIHPMLSEKES